MKGKCYRCSSGEDMANNCSVAKDEICRSCNSLGHITAGCIPIASVRAVERESNQGGTLALEYQSDKQQQQQKAAQVN